MPGYVPGFLQPIENRILMISTGIRAQLGIKILGDNLDALQQKAFEVEQRRARHPRRRRGRPVARAGQTLPRNRGGPRRHGPLRLARPGRARRGGSRPRRQNVTTTIEGRQRFPIQVRLRTGRARRHRADGRRPGDHPVRQGHPAGPGGHASAATSARARSPARTAASASSSRPTCRTATWAASCRRSRSGSRARSSFRRA